ncbi:hypothetical protein ACFY93_03185 [Streptomyces sp. NPDC008313]|uniref:hypothetical protein n=1 Tax=Streptomyces sp. NPDC008313 TaxID=3364826 RepID=UPI0036E04573
MSWTRGVRAALAVCVLLSGSAGCDSGDTRGDGEEVSASPVGKVLDATDEKGRHYREVDGKGAPRVAVEVQPDARGDGWDVRLTVHGFRFSPAGTSRVAVPGRGLALLYLDGRPIALLRGGGHHLSDDLVPRGTHHVTARLYADDGTVWAVGGRPVESTADITESDASGIPTPAVSATGTGARTEGGGSPDSGGKAS